MFAGENRHGGWVWWRSKKASPFFRHFCAQIAVFSPFSAGLNGWSESRQIRHSSHENGLFTA
jgi:hypothetical protein